MVKTDYLSGEQLAADDWNQVALIALKARVVLPNATTYDQALAQAEGPLMFEILVTNDSDPSKNGLYHYNGTTGVLVPLPLMTIEMKNWIVNMMSVDNPQNT